MVLLVNGTSTTRQVCTSSYRFFSWNLIAVINLSSSNDIILFKKPKLVKLTTIRGKSRIADFGLAIFHTTVLSSNY